MHSTEFRSSYLHHLQWMGGNVFTTNCLSVFLLCERYLKKLWRIRMKFGEQIVCVTRTKWFDFGEDPNPDSDLSGGMRSTECPFSLFMLLQSFSYVISIFVVPFHDRFWPVMVVVIWICRIHKEIRHRWRPFSPLCLHNINTTLIYQLKIKISKCKMYFLKIKWFFL